MTYLTKNQRLEVEEVLGRLRGVKEVSCFNYQVTEVKITVDRLSNSPTRRAVSETGGFLDDCFPCASIHFVVVGIRP